MKLIYIHLSNSNCDFDEEYFVGFNRDFSVALAQEEADISLEEYIDKYEEDYFIEMGIDDPTDEDYEEYCSSCQVVWFPVTKAIYDAMMDSGEFEIVDDYEEDEF